MKAEKKSLTDFLRQYDTIFDIPVYQRNYEWTEDQCTQFFNDLLDVVNMSDLRHFFGTVVLVDEENTALEHRYLIIDGQQRLITVSLFLRALMKLDSGIESSIKNQYLCNTDLKKNNSMKIKPIARDYKAYHSVITNDVVYPGISKIVENYNLFLNLIQHSDATPSELFNALAKFDIVCIELDGHSTDENPQVVFESLNSTGLSLTQSDLTRNLLLMGTDSDTQERLYKSYWSKIEDMMPENMLNDFIYYYLALKTGRAGSKKGVYQNYKKYYFDNHLQPEPALKDLYNYSQYYSRIYYHNTNDHDFNESLKHITIVNSKLAIPFALLLISMVYSDKMTQKQANKLIRYVENFLLRAEIVNMGSYDMRPIMFSLCRKLPQSSDFEKDALLVLQSKFPTNKQVTDSFSLFECSGAHRKPAKMFLEILDSNKSKTDVEPVVDHIFPLKPNSEWQIKVHGSITIAHRYGNLLGNLALVSDSSNLGNNLFNIKKKNYVHSEYSLTRELIDFDTWDQPAIMNRTKQLAQAFIDEYPYPKFKSATKHNMSGKTFMLNQGVDITGLQPKSITIGYKESYVSSWVNMLKIVLDHIWSSNSSDFKRLMKDPSLKSKLFTTKRSPLMLQNGHTVEGNHSASDTLAIIRRIVSLLHISSNISYTIK